jgi:ERCC4-related helicase
MRHRVLNSGGQRLTSWEQYLGFLDEGPYSVELLSSNLVPTEPCPQRKHTIVSQLNYTLWPFQKKILADIGSSTLILGLPTGLGKTYLAGAQLRQESANRPIRVLFLVPTIPLGVQQTLFVREKLGVNAFFVSGGIPSGRRETLRVWNNPFLVATPQTFYNDNLAQYGPSFKAAKNTSNPVKHLKNRIAPFPFDVVVADECQRYIGATKGYATLLAARSQATTILALSATPQLHAPQRLKELRSVFDQIKTFSVDEPELRQYLPERVLVVDEVATPPTLMKTYHAMGDLIRSYGFRIRKMYRRGHSRNCTKHPLCRAQLAVRMLRRRLIEDGASSVEQYGTWKFRDLQNKRKFLDGQSISHTYQQALHEQRNHKFGFVRYILAREVYQKAIVYVESVEGAKELATQLQTEYGVEDVVCLVGKGDMTANQQTSALLQFRQRARILICTSVGEEGLDIPSADIEVWVDPPSNPQQWIQRFGRVLRQPGGKHHVYVHALISKGTHEKNKLFKVKRNVENVYGFTQQLELATLKATAIQQRNITEFLR